MVGVRFTPPLYSIEINIQVRAIESIPAIGTGNLAVLLAHLRAATIAEVNMFLWLGHGVRFWRWSWFHTYEYTAVKITSDDFPQTPTIWMSKKARRLALTMIISETYIMKLFLRRCVNDFSLTTLLFLISRTRK